MDLASLETFLAVAQTGSMAEAARQVYVSQGTASTRIKALEDELGVALFDRARGVRGVTLTPQGEQLLPIALQQVALWGQALELCDRPVRQRLRIAAVDGLNASVLARAYRMLATTHPEIYLDVLTVHSREAYDLLESGQADVGFVFQLHKSAHVDARPLYRESWGVVCPSDAPFAQTQKLASLDPAREVVRRWRPEFDEWHRNHIRSGAPALSVGTTSMLGPVLRGSDLWSIVPAGIGEAIAEGDQSLVFLPLRDCPPPGPEAHVLLPKKALPWVKDAVDTLMDVVTEVIAQDKRIISARRSTEREGRAYGQHKNY